MVLSSTVGHLPPSEYPRHPLIAPPSSPIGGYTKNYEGKRVTGVQLNDTWLLKVPPIGEDGVCDFKKFKWEKRKNPGNPPNPVRSGEPDSGSCLPSTPSS